MSSQSVGSLDLVSTGSTDSESELSRCCTSDLLKIGVVAVVLLEAMGVNKRGERCHLLRMLDDLKK